MTYSITRTTSNNANVIVASDAQTLDIEVDYSDQIRQFISIFGAMSATQNTISATMSNINLTLANIDFTIANVNTTHANISLSTARIDSNVGLLSDLAGNEGIHIITPWEWLSVASLLDYYGNVEVLSNTLLNYKQIAENNFSPYFDPDESN